MKRRTAAPGIQVSLARFRVDGGVGPHGFFPGQPGHGDEAAARVQWQRDRRATWAATHRFRIPGAAVHHDGLSWSGWPTLWGTWSVPTFDVGPVVAAVADDLAAVAAFEERDPDGADEIADYLAAWRDDLDIVRDVAAACAVHADDRLARAGLDVVGKITTARRYGGSRS